MYNLRGRIMRNKRKNKRRNCSVPVEGKAGGVFHRTQTIDISNAGIGLISRKKIPLQKKITLELELSKERVPVFVVGKVEWVRPIINSRNYRVGMSFANVLKGSKSSLSQYFL